MLKIGLSPAITLQISVKMCAASKYCKKFTKNPLWGFKVVQSHWCW